MKQKRIISRLPQTTMKTCSKRSVEKLPFKQWLRTALQADVVSNTCKEANMHKCHDRCMPQVHTYLWFRICACPQVASGLHTNSSPMVFVCRRWAVRLVRPRSMQHKGTWVQLARQGTWQLKPQETKEGKGGREKKGTPSTHVTCNKGRHPAQTTDERTFAQRRNFHKKVIKLHMGSNQDETENDNFTPVTNNHET